jgi:hypothetical protein
MDDGMDTSVQVASPPPDHTGVRICPGRHLVYASLWINIASILATFEISRAADSAPHGVLSSDEQFTAEFVRYIRLPSFIDRQADTNCLPVGRSRSNVRSNHALRRRRNWSLDCKVDEVKHIKVLFNYSFESLRTKSYVHKTVCFHEKNPNKLNTNQKLKVAHAGGRKEGSRWWSYDEETLHRMKVAAPNYSAHSAANCSKGYAFSAQYRDQA